MRRYLPALELGDLKRGRSGVRAQVVDREGRLVDDFLIEQAPGVLHVVNAPSPAATASLALASHIVDQLKGVRPL
jgi:(S)-2-hydroxyglutarate dehydrogenase